MLKRLSKSKALVACHDAGAANQILYLTHALDNVEYLLGKLLDLYLRSSSII